MELDDGHCQVALQLFSIQAPYVALVAFVIIPMTTYCFARDGE